MTRTPDRPCAGAAGWRDTGPTITDVRHCGKPPPRRPAMKNEGCATEPHLEPIQNENYLESCKTTARSQKTTLLCNELA
jgi:hypothetical protein